MLEPQAFFREAERKEATERDNFFFVVVVGLSVG
jgi:hypothetical protein